jgi:hypothetical protein
MNAMLFTNPIPSCFQYVEDRYIIAAQQYTKSHKRLQVFLIAKMLKKGGTGVICRLLRRDVWKTVRKYLR